MSEITLSILVEYLVKVVGMDASQLVDVVRNPHKYREEYKEAILFDTLRDVQNAVDKIDIEILLSDQLLRDDLQGKVEQLAKLLLEI